MKLFNHPLFGLKWQQKGALSKEQDFHAFLTKQLKNWKGSYDSITVTKHTYWPTFHDKVVQAVRKTYGTRITLYRAIYGKIALHVIQGKPLPTRAASAWSYEEWVSDDHIAKQKQTTHWALIKAVFRPEDVLIAPVELPDYIQPKVLNRFKNEHEFIILNPSANLPTSRFTILKSSRDS